MYVIFPFKSGFSLEYWLNMAKLFIFLKWENYRLYNLTVIIEKQDKVSCSTLKNKVTFRRAKKIILRWSLKHKYFGKQ